MLQRILLFLYHTLPSNIIRWVGASRRLAFFRKSLLFDHDGKYREVEVEVDRQYSGYHVNFRFVAPPRVAEKARGRGIENTILNSSLRVLQTACTSTKPTILDIGANFGYLSFVWACSVCSKAGIVYSFEPNPYAFKKLCTSIRINQFDNVMPYKLALANEDKVDRIYLSAMSANLSDSKIEYTEKADVQIQMVDTFVRKNRIRHIDMIKIDVDGNEYEVLRGARDTMKKWKPTLIVETNDDFKIVQFLEDLGYCLYDQHLNGWQSGLEKLPLNLFAIAHRQ